MEQVYSNVAIACGLIISLTAVAASIGISLLGSRYLESTARQPELLNTLYLKMLIIACLIDASFIIATGLALWFAMQTFLFKF
ncbi:MAG: F0F1 ATP synthase subunit C [Candidatus Accumulibacter sp.]|jgi:F-type H+-transporting ATPase subunit c|nr:F0F1 ATP synthase subunit C [Accumulibacter sp.]